MSSYRIHVATGEWEVVIGLEVHAQITCDREGVQRLHSPWTGLVVNAG